MTNFKLRLKHPSGAEFEAEGPAEFILTEKANFLNSMDRGARREQQSLGAAPAQADPGQAFWDKIVTTRDGQYILTTKPPGMTAGEAALILLAASKAKDGEPDLGAISLSRAVKASGYAPDRLDRLLAQYIKAGRITASGTKRNRTYAITESGVSAAWAAAKKMKL